MGNDLKTQENDASVSTFIESLSDPQQIADSRVLLTLFSEVYQAEARMWGDSIIGFGHYQYRYSSGREGTWMRGGFSPRKGKFSLYIMDGFDRYQELLEKLGKFKTGKSCLYLNRLEQVDLYVLRELLEGSFAHMQEMYPE